MLKFSGKPAVPQDVQTSLQSLLDNTDLLSPELKAFLLAARTHEAMHLIVEVRDQGQDAHGDTGSYVSLPKAERGTLIQEAFLSSPNLILGRHETFIKIVLSAGPGTSPVQASTTLLHELELHAAPAGHLLLQLSRTQAGDDARLGLVLDHVRKAEEHTDLDHQEQYVRSAARIRAAAGNGPSGGWAAGLLQAVAVDAAQQYEAYECARSHKDGTSDSRVQWLKGLIGRIAQQGPDAVAAGPRPPARVAAALNPAPGLDPVQLVAARLTARVPLLDILNEARTVPGQPIAKVLALYCGQLVPALLAQAPGCGLTDVVQQKVFLNFHGVPDMVALDALENEDTVRPAAPIAHSWPPADKPVFWLTSAERDNWSQLTGLPASVRQSRAVADGSYLLLDGEVYRAAVRDARPAQEPQTTRFFPQDATGKFVALLKQ